MHLNFYHTLKQSIFFYFPDEPGLNKDEPAQSHTVTEPVPPSRPIPGV